MRKKEKMGMQNSKRFFSLALAGVLASGAAMAAVNGWNGTSVSFASSEDEDEVTVTDSDKPYLALGADLTDDELSTVLELLGIEEDDLDDYDVVYITNEMEHEYLDSYISSSTIGTRALSSVVVIEGKRNSGVEVTTKNISYCTTGMYENAMVTAGIEDAEAIVAGPFEISGTAALIGVIEAYSVMTGEDIDEENVDAALEEIVITGEIKESTDADEDEIEGMIAYLKEETAGEDLTEEEIDGLIDDAEETFEVSLSEEDREMIKELLDSIQDLDLDIDSLEKQAQSLYDKLDSMGYDMDELLEEAEGFFKKLIAKLKELFS